MKFENTMITNFENAILGARNPMESHKRMDSFYNKNGEYILGPNDLGLMQRLLKASMAQGNSHSKFMRQILVSVNITAPLYWWKEVDQYRVGVTTNSESTMHRLAKTPITLDCFETDDYDPDLSLAYDREDDDYDDGLDDISVYVEDMIMVMENLRKAYLATDDKRYWKELIRLLPEGWLQKRMTTLNYQVLRQMYFDRRNHKLTEWSKSFVEWVKTLPYAEELIMYEGDDKNA
ncbi:hypothetical protein DW954_02905 [Clostridium sp. AM45-5]|nr:hypothetical protein [Clostridium sp. AM45-5]RHS68303.1 hypothetical protein DW954_02905 [Clostridium sp. AM45-5]